MVRTRLYHVLDKIISLRCYQYFIRFHLLLKYRQYKSRLYIIPIKNCTAFGTIKVYFSYWKRNLPLEMISFSLLNSSACSQMYARDFKIFKVLCKSINDLISRKHLSGYLHLPISQTKQFSLGYQITFLVGTNCTLTRTTNECWLQTIIVRRLSIKRKTPVTSSSERSTSPLLKSSLTCC